MVVPVGRLLGRTLASSGVGDGRSTQGALGGHVVVLLVVLAEVGVLEKADRLLGVHAGFDERHQLVLVDEIGDPDDGESGRRFVARVRPVFVVGQGVVPIASQEQALLSTRAVLDLADLQATVALLARDPELLAHAIGRTEVRRGDFAPSVAAMLLEERSRVLALEEVHVGLFDLLGRGRHVAPTEDPRSAVVLVPVVEVVHELDVEVRVGTIRFAVVVDAHVAVVVDVVTVHLLTPSAIVAAMVVEVVVRQGIVVHELPQDHLMVHLTIRIDRSEGLVDVHLPADLSGPATIRAGPILGGAPVVLGIPPHLVLVLRPLLALHVGGFGVVVEETDLVGHHARFDQSLDLVGHEREDLPGDLDFLVVEELETGHVVLVANPELAPTGQSGTAMRRRPLTELGAPLGPLRPAQEAVAGVGSERAVVAPGHLGGLALGDLAPGLPGHATRVAGLEADPEIILVVVDHVELDEAVLVLAVRVVDRHAQLLGDQGRGEIELVPGVELVVDHDTEVAVALDVAVLVATHLGVVHLHAQVGHVGPRRVALGAARRGDVVALVGVLVVHGNVTGLHVEVAVEQILIEVEGVEAPDSESGQARHAEHVRAALLAHEHSLNAGSSPAGLPLWGR